MLRPHRWLKSETWLEIQKGEIHGRGGEEGPREDRGRGGTARSRRIKASRRAWSPDSSIRKLRSLHVHCLIFFPSILNLFSLFFLSFFFAFHSQIRQTPRIINCTVLNLNFNSDHSWINFLIGLINDDYELARLQWGSPSLFSSQKNQRDINILLSFIIMD